MGQVTISGNNYDIYGTSAGADIYIAGKITDLDWSGLPATKRAQALVSGTRLIRDYLKLKGFDLDPADAVDAKIEEANYELAFLLAFDPSVAEQSTAETNIKALGAGSARVEYFRPVAGGRFPSIVQNLLASWLADQISTESSLTAGYNGSACNESSLSPCDWQLDRPL
jgi:hypothetical protein